MHDFSFLVGETFLQHYNDADVFIHGAYLHDGKVTLIVSNTSGGGLFETTIDCLRSKPRE